MDGFVNLNLGDFPIAETQILVLNFFISSIRIGAFIISAPLFGSTSVPLQVRIITILFLASFFYPDAAIPDFQRLSTEIFLYTILGEIIIGLTFGLVLSIVFASAAIAGEKIAATSGLSFAAQVDPNSEGQTPVVSQFLSLFLITIFLTLNGHIVALEVVGMSYQQIPIGYGIDFETVAKAGVTAGKDMFSQTLTIAFPIVAVLLLISITVGVITRSAPQLNLFSFGFPLTLISVFIILYLNTESLAFGMHDMIMDTLEKLKLIFGEKS